MRQIRLGIFDAVPVEYYLPGEKSDPEKFIDMFEGTSAPFDYVTYQATEGQFPIALGGRTRARRMAPAEAIDTHLMPEAQTLRARFGAEVFQQALDRAAGLQPG